MKNSPSALDALLSTVRADGEAATAHIDEGWMQGRTAYGGISSAVALAGTMLLHPTEAPLRYAQISFVGPVGGDCTIATRVLRQSKSSLFIDAGVSSDAGFGTAAAFAKEIGKKDDHAKLQAATKDCYGADEYMTKLAETSANANAKKD